MTEIATSGKRKLAIAKIVLSDGDGKITVNKKDFELYFRGEIEGAIVTLI